MRKHKILYWIISIAFGLMTVKASAQNNKVKPLVRKGNELFKKGKFSDAEVEYRKALEKDPKYQKAQFNLGDAIYQEKNFKGATPLFNNLIKNSKSNELKANSLYNLGNTLMSQKKYESSIEAYIKSLLLNPNNYNAKYNLEYARKMLKKQKQNKKQNKNNKNKNNKKQNKKQNKKKNNKNKNNKQKNKNNQNKNKNNKQNNKNKNQNGKGKNQKQPNQPPRMSKADAQRMLDALRNNEKNTLKNLEKKKAKAVKTKPNGIGW